MRTTLLAADAVRTCQGVVGDALVVVGDRVAAVGAIADLRRVWSVPERAIRGTIVPGLRDAHLHPVGYAAALFQPALKAAPDFDAIADILSEAIRTRPDGSAITALRLDDESLAEGRLPDRHMLDAVSQTQPILLMRYCGHIAVANTTALALAGIDRNTKNPAGGTIDRDDTGIPTGVLRETAFEPVTAALRLLAPPITPDQIGEGLLALAATGLTGVGAMAATDSGLWGGARSELDSLISAAERSPIDVGVFVIAPTPAALAAAADRIRAAPGRIRFLGVKMFSDGSLGGHTAAMHEGFADRPGETGTDRLDPGWAMELAEAALSLGGRVAVHAIGDRANGGVLDLMDRLIQRGADPNRLRVEHASVLTAADIDRFGTLGVTASVQPAFIASETDWLEKRLGSNRIRRTYAFRSLADAGAPLAGGSDCPVEPPHPLLGMAAVRDRLGLVPAESLSAVEALRLFTAGAATAIGADASLEPGSPADFTILDVDPVTATPDELRRASVVEAWVGGVAVPIPTGITTWQG